MSTSPPIAPSPPVPARGHRPEGLAARRPVAAFVAVLVLAATLLALLRWSGAANPWIGSTSVAVSDAGSELVVELGVRNRGLLPVELDRLTIEGRSVAGADLFLEADGTSTGRPVAPVPGWEAAYRQVDRFTLAGGAERRVLVVLPAGCDRLMGSLDVTARVETALGRRRTVTVTTLDPWTAGDALTDGVPPC